MSEIRDKYQEPLEGDPSAFSEKVGLEKDKPVSKGQEILELERKLAEKKAELSQEAVPEKIEKPEPQPTPEASAGEAEIVQETKKIEPIKEKEIIKQELKKPVEEEVAPAASASKLSSKVQAKIKKLKDLDQKSQIKELCILAFSENLDFAVSVAKGLNNAYVLDEFHDALVDELYDRLVEEGELKKF